MKRIAVLMGGLSEEREVSLASGKAIANALEKRGYPVDRIDVQTVAFEVPEGTDLVFIALHGTFGEDGQVQAILDAKGIPYTGADAESSRIAFDKVLSKKRFEDNGIRSPDYEVIRKGQERKLPLPVIVKPPRQGSSIGLHKVTSEDEWSEAISDAFEFDDEILVEAFIPGQEVTVGIVGQSVFPVVEIRAPHGHYDYKAKYTKGETEYLCPAPLAEDVTTQCQQLALATFHALDAKGLGRVDLRVSDEGIPYVLELNTIPGFTETSLLPKAANAAGISFPDLCENIVREALGLTNIS